MVIVLAIAVIAVLVIAGLVVGAIALASSSRKTAKRDATIPGVDVAVPQEWALGHDPEARLHRRIGAVVTALDNSIGQAGVADLERRAQLMNTAADLDQKLVAIWSLPRDAKPAALADIEPRVAAFETAATTQVLNPEPGLGSPRIPDLPPVPDPPAAATDPKREPPRAEPESPA